MEDDIMVDNSEIEEVKDFLNLKKEIIEEEEVAIIFDGKQHSVRIPKKFAESAEIIPKEDAFIFKLVRPPVHTDKEPQLTGKLKRGGND